MKITQMQRRTTVAAHLVTFFREHIYIDKDPPDADYQQRYAKEMIDGFRLLSLLVFATTAALFLFYIMQTGVRAARPYEALSTVTCALLALAGGVGPLVSKSIRSPAAALLATAALLVASCAVLTIDRLQQFASGDRLAPSLIPIIFSTLMLGAAVLPLRPHRVLWLGVLLLASCGLAALFTNVPFQGDLIGFVGAGTVVAVSVVIAARSTSQRIRDQADLGFAVVGAHVRASGWDLVAARQLVRENGGELRLDRLEAGQQVVTITLPANTPLSGRDIQGAAVGVA